MHAHHLGPSQARQPAGLRAPGGRNAAARALGSGGGQAAAVLTLQRLAGNAAVTRLIAARQRDLVQAALRSPGRPLGEQVRADMEARLGADLSGVRVHTGPAADQAARAVSADAFTTGSRLVFRQGSYDPSAQAGRRVLAHELAHVLQQRRGPVTGSSGPLRISHPADRFEREAEATARRATGSQPAARPLTPASQVPIQQGTAPAGALSAGTPVQRHYTGMPHIYYNAADLYQDSGVYMHAELHPGQLQTGSAPSVYPSWWSGAVGKSSAVTQQWLSHYMVRGHLLNMKVGGSGATMANLTMITKACNHAHEQSLEQFVKQEVLTNKNVVDYAVWAVYKPKPKGVDIVGSTAGAHTATVASDIDNYFAKGLPHHIFGQFTVYNAAGQAKHAQPYDVLNESH